MFTKISPYVFPGIRDTSDYKKVVKFNRDRISKEDVLTIVAEHCGVKVSKILTRIREREVIDARHMYIAVMRYMFRYTTPDIGRLVDRDHTTILDSLKKYNIRYMHYDDYRKVSDAIFETVKNKIS